MCEGGVEVSVCPVDAGAGARVEPQHAAVRAAGVLVDLEIGCPRSIRNYRFPFILATIPWEGPRSGSSDTLTGTFKELGWQQHHQQLSVWTTSPKSCGQSSAISGGSMGRTIVSWELIQGARRLTCYIS